MTRLGEAIRNASAFVGCAPFTRTLRDAASAANEQELDMKPTNPARPTWRGPRSPSALAMSFANTCDGRAHTGIRCQQKTDEWDRQRTGVQGSAAQNLRKDASSPVSSAYRRVLSTCRTTSGRFLIIPLGAWIALAPWLLACASPAGRWSGVLVGFLLVALSIPRGTIRKRYGRWQRYER